MSLSLRDLEQLGRQADEAIARKLALTKIPPEALLELVCATIDGRAAQRVLDSLECGGS